MKLSAPKNLTFWISIFFAVAGVVIYMLPTSALDVLGLILLLVGFALLAFGNLLKGL